MALPPPHSLHSGLLQDRIVNLAGTPDGSFRIDTDLIVVAQLAARLIVPADHASVTAHGDDGYVTVAASSDVAVTLDQAQYRDNAGPCLDALDAGYPAAVPDIAATMTWQRFRDAAVQATVHTSLSVPLFAGSGTTIASLNLYSHTPGAMTLLTTAVWAVQDPQAVGPWNRDLLDPGSRELTAGLIAAHALRAMIGRALAVLAATSNEDHDDGAYLRLCRQAAQAGTSLSETAARIIEHQP